MGNNIPSIMLEPPPVETLEHCKKYNVKGYLSNGTPPKYTGTAKHNNNISIYTPSFIIVTKNIKDVIYASAYSFGITRDIPYDKILPSNTHIVYTKYIKNIPGALDFVKKLTAEGYVIILASYGTDTFYSYTDVSGLTKNELDAYVESRYNYMFISIAIPTCYDEEWNRLNLVMEPKVGKWETRGDTLGESFPDTLKTYPNYRVNGRHPEWIKQSKDCFTYVSADDIKKIEYVHDVVRELFKIGCCTFVKNMKNRIYDCCDGMYLIDEIIADCDWAVLMFDSKENTDAFIKKFNNILQEQAKDRMTDIAEALSKVTV